MRSVGEFPEVEVSYQMPYGMAIEMKTCLILICRVCNHVYSAGGVMGLAWHFQIFVRGWNWSIIHWVGFNMRDKLKYCTHPFNN
jgi:hypothetical protein